MSAPGPDDTRSGCGMPFLAHILWHRFVACLWFALAAVLAGGGAYLLWTAR